MKTALIVCAMSLFGASPLARRIAGAALLVAGCLLTPAQAQVPGGGGVQQHGNITVGHCAKWFGNKSIEDSGGTCGGGGSPAGSAGDIQTYATSTTFGSITPATGIATFLATPSGANLASALTTAIPATKGGTGLTALGTNVATFLGTPSSANLAAALTDETGSGAAVFGTNPTLVGATFTGAVIGNGRIVSGTTDGPTAADCGGTIHFTSGSGITVTMPDSITTLQCTITFVQEGAGQITFAAGGGATIHSAHSYTKTFGQWAVVDMILNTNAGGSSAVYTLAGDGA